MSWELILEIAPILAISGIFAGFLAGLLGVGGGIIFVPVLYFVFMKFLKMPADVAITIATSTSLATMIPTSCASCFSHILRANVDFQLLKQWVIFLLLGVGAGIIFSANFGGLWLIILFGIVLMLAAINMLFFAKADPLFKSLPKMPQQALMPFFISSISVMLGIGGGTLTVPTLSLFSYDTRKAVGVASTIGLIICLPGALITLINDLINSTPIVDATGNVVAMPPLTVGHICFLAVLLIIPCSMCMAPLGVKINKKIPPHIIKRLFAVLMILTSIRMLLSGFGF